MTTAQQKGIRYALLILGGAVTVAASAGYTQRSLEGKEDKTDHVMDLAEVRQALSNDRQLRELQRIRDSSLVSTLLQRITEVACDQNPHRGYC